MRFACLGFNVNPAGWAELEWRLLAIVANTKVLHDSRALDTQVEWWPPNDVVICIKIIHSGYCPLQEHVLIALWHDFIWDLGRALTELWQDYWTSVAIRLSERLSRGYQVISEEYTDNSDNSMPKGSISILYIYQSVTVIFCIFVLYVGLL